VPASPSAGHSAPDDLRHALVAHPHDAEAKTRARTAGVELTEPYALLLTEGLFEQAEAEARTIEKGRSGSEALPTGPVSIYEHMAELESRRSKTYLAWQRINELYGKRFDNAQRAG
jgi:hypothetical protein